MSDPAAIPPNVRRTPEQWQQLVSEWQHSSASAKQFCEERGIGYVSFCQWRKRLSLVESAPKQKATPGFIDLGALSSGTPGQWRIVLKLGNGVELSLSQH